MRRPGIHTEERYALTPEEARQYQEDGFFVRRAAFCDEELAILREAVEEVVRSAASSSGLTYEIDGNRYCETSQTTVQYEHRPEAKTIRVVEPFHHLHSDLDRLVDDPRLTEPIRGILGCEAVALWTEKINCKRPFEGSGFRWHQDSPYWSHACDETDRLPNVMIALDDAAEQNGCFRIIRGSHRAGFLPGLEDQSELGPLFTDPRYFNESDQVAAVVPAGSQVFFSPHSVHGSEPNRSDHQRRAMILTYQPGDRRMFKIDEVRNVGSEPLRSQVAS